MEPGIVMKEAKTHMISRPPDEVYYVSEIGKRAIRHMEECRWIGDTQRGQNCIYLIYDGIHYNALKLI